MLAFGMRDHRGLYRTNIRLSAKLVSQADLEPKDLRGGQPAGKVHSRFVAGLGKPRQIASF